MLDGDNGSSLGIVQDQKEKPAKYKIYNIDFSDTKDSGEQRSKNSGICHWWCVKWHYKH